jgi:hypothetical protein
MFETIFGFIKALFGKGGATQVGKGNRAVVNSTGGANSPILSAGRDLSVTMHGRASEAPKTERDELVEWIRQNGFREPLSHVLSQIVRLAQIAGNADVEHWARLELFGYNADGGMREDEIVPEYRTIVGQLISEDDRPLMLPERLAFLNTFRLRYGVGMLEEWAKTTEMQNIAHSGILDMVRRELNVHAARLCFNPVAIVQILNIIRNHALDKAQRLA